MRVNKKLYVKKILADFSDLVFRNGPKKLMLEKFVKFEKQILKEIQKW